MLEEGLAKAYGPVRMLMRPRVRADLNVLRNPVPTLIDGRLVGRKWIAGRVGPGPSRLLKTDYEHHGMGKGELNLDDPAFDLAETILDLDLSQDEETRLLTRYSEQSGDAGIGDRLFAHKLLAGFWTMAAARKSIFSSALDQAGQRAQHDTFMKAWHFLAVEAARACGALCAASPLPRHAASRGPMVALDVDGVIDRRTFGFPCATAASIEALSLLKAQGMTIILDTARSLAEVQAYCAAYGLAGGVAEHGAVLWDAMEGREKVCIAETAHEQLERLRSRLRSIPGVFLDNRHQYSIKAFAYREGKAGLLATLRSAWGSGGDDVGHAPLPTLLMNALFQELKLDQLAYHHTSIDTAVVVKACDKGTGLLAMRDWLAASATGDQAAGGDSAHIETVAVGDSEPDIAMFRVATHSFAPAHIGCAREARLAGCRIAQAPTQRGFLEIAKEITRIYGKAGERGLNSSGVQSTLAASNAAAEQGWWLGLLRAADRSSASHMLRALRRPSALRALLR